MPQLDERSKFILKVLEKSQFTIAELLEKLHKADFKLTKVTLNRDLRLLIEEGLISVEGEGRSTRYKLSPKYKLFKHVDFAEYFYVDSDDRTVQEEFDFHLLNDLAGIFPETEQIKLDEINDKYKSNVKKTSQTLYRKELERLIIELSWKSSKLEGNTYTLLDTERLIKEKIETKGHSKEEAIMILNHKTALDYIIKNQKLFTKIDINKIQKIHSLLVSELDIPAGFRTKKVGIIGTKYKPLAKEADINKAMQLLCQTINAEKYPLAKALIAIAMISYIQAFQDGNKRTARILATGILLAHGYCPLSYRNVDEYDYKKCLLLFYEQNNIVYLKRLFMEQFKFSVNEYF